MKPASRISEALKLAFGDLNLETNRLKVINLKQRKKNSFRLIKISDRLNSLILQEQLSRNVTKEDFILKIVIGLPTTMRLSDMPLKPILKEIERIHIRCVTLVPFTFWIQALILF